ncbi:hypothetical protein PG994_001239 [Apiospora phragmitis]|uniref:Uncharacterized protein n=1 Tax=Apiospora phragmitis TaxID=2905665 RepID=A0ABR1WT00_9PEZI
MTISQPTEHVVLADCKNGNNVLQSQMAYFNATSPENKPQDTAVVGTTDGQLATWFCGSASGQFTTTGVKFNATLGGKRSEGDYVGNGTNGYDYDNGGFRCFQQYQRNLYKQGQFACSEVVRCDHNPPPSPLPSISCSAASDDGGDTAAPHGLARDAQIGIGVGCGVAGLIALAAIALVWRHFRKRRRLAAELPTEGGGVGGGGEFAAYNGQNMMTSDTANTNYYYYHHQHHPQELDAAHARVEADTSSPLGELHAPVNHQQHEMETPESRLYAHYDAEGNTLPRT